MKKCYRPRNDYVLVELVDLGVSPGGVAIPQISSQGKKCIVLAVGPDVEDLEVGDSVQIVPTKEVSNYFALPSEKSMFLLRQELIAVVITEPVVLDQNPSEQEPFKDEAIRSGGS